MKFSVQKYEQLIELVKNNPCLYDTSSAQYKSLQTQQNTWKEIANEMNDSAVSWKDWRRIWKQKRDSFQKKRRELELNCPSGLAVKQLIRRSPLFERMLFLLEHIKGRSTEGVVNNEPEYEFSDEEQSYHSKHEDDDYDDMEEPSTPRSITSTPPMNSLQRLTKDSDDSDIFRPHQNLPSVSKPQKFKKKERDQRFDQIIEQINARSSANLDAIKYAVLKLSESCEDDTNIFHFLSKRVKTFSRDTQDWMEDEVLKLYMEAKRREKCFTSQQTCPRSEDFHSASAVNHK